MLVKVVPYFLTQHVLDLLHASFSTSPISSQNTPIQLLISVCAHHLCLILLYVLTF
ncbi:uncharacterized protein DS421_8g230470 [Arachis hypogaea]|nr:uncharacterized protein DS421_8g230470 [Arachis hypogaea]